MTETSREFFDALGEQYGAAIRRCVPRYAEMLDAMLDYLPADFEPRRILELGCGDGNLSCLLGQRFPTADLHLVDLSGQLLAVCRQRLQAMERVELEQADFGRVDYPPGSFDLVASCIAIHHLPDAGKRELYRRARRWLRPGGRLVVADQFAGGSPAVSERHLARWYEEARRLGASDADWQVWMDHQRRHDHHATLVDQLRWLEDAGFQELDCPWRYLLWTIVLATAT